MIAFIDPKYRSAGHHCVLFREALTTVAELLGVDVDIADLRRGTPRDSVAPVLCRVTPLAY